MTTPWNTTIKIAARTASTMIPFREYQSVSYVVRAVSGENLSRAIMEPSLGKSAKAGICSQHQDPGGCSLEEIVEVTLSEQRGGDLRKSGLISVLALIHWDDMCLPCDESDTQEDSPQDR